MNLNNDIIKRLQQTPEETSPEEIRALAYLWPNSMEVLLLRNQQIRLLKERVLQAKLEYYGAQERTTKYARWLVGWTICSFLIGHTLGWLI